MPSNKILTVLILCLGIITAVWLIDRKPATLSLAKENIDAIDVTVQKKSEPAIQIDEAADADWKKILVSVDSKTQKVTDLTKSNENTFDETTLTAQISKDFFSQYLVAKKSGEPVTPDEVNKIVQNTLQNSQYTKPAEIVYLPSNLHIDERTDLVTLRKYRDTLNLSLKTRSMQIKDNPVTIFNTAVKANSATMLARLDLIIDVGHGMVSDLVQMSVPKEAVNMHLALLNAIANTNSNLEAMKKVFNDPIGSFVGSSSYSKNVIQFQTALNNINAYFVSQLGSSQ